MGKKILACCTQSDGKSTMLDGGKDLERNNNKINKLKGKRGP